MKRIVFIFLLFLSNEITCSTYINTHVLYTYDKIPKWYYDDTVWLEIVAISLSKWLSHFTSDYVPHRVNKIRRAENAISFISYNRDCIMCVRFNKKKQEVQIEIFDKSNYFNEQRFKAITDFYFRYN